MSDLYVPSEWGARFHALPGAPKCDFALGAGSAGPGKSMVLLMEPIQQVQIEHARCLVSEGDLTAAKSIAKEGSWLYNLIVENPLKWGMSRGWALHMRRKATTLRETLQRARRIFPTIDPGATYNSTERTWTFRCGYIYEFGHCKDLDDWENYMSREFTIICWDELTQFEEEQFDQISTRIRSPDPVLRFFLKNRAMSNPMMKQEEGITVNDPFWVRRRFVDPCRSGNKLLKTKFTLPDGTEDYTTSIYLPATIDDNPDKVFVEQYKRKLASAKPHIRQALLFGNWYVVAGSFFADVWNPSLHICRPFLPPPHWKFFRSMDWGYKKPGTVGWYAMDPEETLFKIKELNFQLKTAAWVAKEVRRVERALGFWDKVRDRSKLIGPADTQIWEQRGDVGKSKAEEFESFGISWVPADKRSRQRNAERITERLADHNHGMTTPGLVVFETCTRVIETLPVIPASKNNPEEPADGGDDHWLDELGYACAFASHGLDGIPSSTGEDDWWGDEEREAARRRGRYGYGQEIC